MKGTRKKRAPKINLVALSAHKEALGDRDLLVISTRFDHFEKLRSEGMINTPFIAMEALSTLAQGKLSGKTEAELRDTWPKTWGEATMAVPLPLLLAISDAWSKYKEADQVVTLGEAFGLEAARKSGSHRMKSLLATLDREMRHATAVHLEYLAATAEGSPKSLEQVIDEVAEANALSTETIKLHYKKHKDNLHNGLKEKGILKE